MGTENRHLKMDRVKGIWYLTYAYANGVDPDQTALGAV